MRWRFSWWDAVVPLLLATELAGIWWVLAHASGPVPTHWGPGGVPDRFGPPEWTPRLIMLLVNISFYVGVRAIDSLILVRRPEFYGFMTNVAGGMSVMMSVVDGMALASIAQPGFPMRPLPAFGAFFVYMGWLLRVTPDVPFNTAGLIPNTREARQVVGRILGLWFMVTGVLTAVLGLLPGSLELLALVPLILGPMIGVVAAVARVPTKRSR